VLRKFFHPLHQAHEFPPCLMQGTGCRLQQFAGSAKCGFSFPNPCGRYGSFSLIARGAGGSVRSQTLPEGETFPTTECQHKAHWERNKLCAIVTELAPGQVLPCCPVVGDETCTLALAGVLQPAVPPAITGPCGRMTWSWGSSSRSSQPSKMESTTAAP